MQKHIGSQLPEHKSGKYIFRYQAKIGKPGKSRRKINDDKHNNITNYKNKSAWKIICKNRLALMSKVSFFLQPGGGDYNKINDYKKKRNEVAHGGYAAGINIPAILTDMKQLYRDLTN